MIKILIKRLVIATAWFIGFSSLNYSSYAQNTISGTFLSHGNAVIRLVGYDGFKTYVMDSTTASASGEFELTYDQRKGGIGYLTINQSDVYILILEDEHIVLRGESLSIPASIDVIQGKQNLKFDEYSILHNEWKRVSNAWYYLQNTYLRDSLFSGNTASIKLIEAEIEWIKSEEAAYISNVDGEYLPRYLKMKKLISSLADIVKYRPTEIPETIEFLRDIDYSSDFMHNSGLLKPAIDSHIWFLQNMGLPLDSAYGNLFTFMDRLLEGLQGNEERVEEILSYLLIIIEDQSLFEAAEYLAAKLGPGKGYSIDSKLSKRLATYGVMKKGEIAPNIMFEGDVLSRGEPIDSLKSIADVESDYKVIFFGSSWCSACAEELAMLHTNYPKWKDKGVEVVFISLDTEKSVFSNFVQPFAFLSFCSYKKWDTQAVEDYFVYATPTLFLLSKSNEILLRPSTLDQLNAWINYNLQN